MLVIELYDVYVVLRATLFRFLFYLRHIPLTFSQNGCFDLV